MNTDYKSLERRYGGPLATKIQEEIARVEQRRFSFYSLPPAMQALQDRMDAYDADEELMSENSKAA